MAGRRGMTRADAREVLEANAEQAAKFTKGATERRMLELLEEADADLTRRITRSIASGDGSFTMEQAKLVRAQVRAVIADLKAGMKSAIVDVGQQAAGQAAAGIVDYLRAADAQHRGVGASPLAIDEARMLDKSATKAKASILRRLASSGEPVEGADAEAHRAKQGILERYGEATIGKFEERLQVGLVTRKPWAEVRQDLIERSDFLQGAPAHWAERIMRTEVASALNRGAHEAIEASEEEVGGMAKILVATFDGRTAWDSYAVHGQIRRPDEPFECFDYAGRRVHYETPPNRPNDREVVAPHNVRWPIPDYLKWRSDGEYKEKFREQYPKRSPPPRPKMTTIPLDKFGKPPSGGGGSAAPEEEVKKLVQVPEDVGSRAEKSEAKEPEVAKIKEPEPEVSKEVAKKSNKISHEEVQSAVSEFRNGAIDDGQATAEAQAKMRGHFNGLVSEHLGTPDYSAEWKRSQAGVVEVNDDEVSYLVLGTGRMSLMKRVVDDAHAFLEEHAAGKTPDDVHAQHMKVIVHETLHSHSPLAPSGYVAEGAALEEVTTELLARRVMRDRYGLKTMGPPHDEPRANRCYDRWIVEVREAVELLLDVLPEVAIRKIENAAIKIRRRGVPIDSPSEYVRQMLEALGAKNASPEKIAAFRQSLVKATTLKSIG